jgi:hypothetical protein
MKMKILKKTVNIELCHALLRTRLRYDAYEKYHFRLHSLSSEAIDKNYVDAPWINKHGFWMYLPDPWQSNAFGLSEKMPQAWETQAVTCMMNFHPEKGSSGFARDIFGGILLVHGGELTTSTGEESKGFFWEHYQGPRLEDESQNRLLAVVAHLGSLDVAKQVKPFLTEMTRIKALFMER